MSKWKFGEIEEIISLCIIPAEIDPETGEILKDEKIDENLFDEAVMLYEEKLEGILLAIKSLDAEIGAIKDEEIALKERRQHKQNRRDRLFEFAQYKLGGEKFETAKVATSYRRSKNVVDIVDKKAIPDEYKVPSGWRENKTAIKEALLAGKEVAGAVLIPERLTMSIK